MTYDVKYEKKAVKQIQKLDSSVQKLIKTWIEKNLMGTTNPRQHGKGLMGNKSEYWRYRVGDYRILAEIRDAEVIIIIVPKSFCINIIPGNNNPVISILPIIVYLSLGSTLGDDNLVVYFSIKSATQTTITILANSLG